MKIAEIRRVIDRLNWTRNDLSGATADEFKRMDIAARLAPPIADCVALEISPRFGREVEGRRNAIARAEAMVARWVALHTDGSATVH